MGKDWNDTDARVHLTKEGNGLSQVVGTLIDREFLFLKEGCWALLAVIYDLACFLQTIDMIGTKSEENGFK